MVGTMEGETVERVGAAVRGGCRTEREGLGVDAAADGVGWRVIEQVQAYPLAAQIINAKLATQFAQETGAGADDGPAV